MRFAAAWAAVASQNVSLRTALLALSVSVVGLGLLTARFGLRDPIIIERGCDTSIANRGTQAPNEAEIQQFLMAVLSMRFDSDAKANPVQLSPAELNARSHEQNELSKRSMKQRLVIQSLKRVGEQFRVDSDRLISVGSIRSAFHSPMLVSIALAPRNALNPYGLVLTKVSPLESKGEESDESK